MPEMNLRNRLHDGLCQQLTGALMFSRALTDALEKGGDPLAADAQTLFRMLDDAANEVHAIMSEMNAASTRKAWDNPDRGDQRPPYCA